MSKLVEIFKGVLFKLLAINLYNQFEQWLIHVFSQNPKSAFRRPKGYYVDSVNNSLKDLVYNMDKKNTPINKKLRKVKRRIIRLIK